MHRLFSVGVFCILGGCAAGSGSARTPTDAAPRITPDRAIAASNATLDRLHAAAARADGPTYWSCFAPDADFIGTDATERWTLAEFKDYADARFARGQGWAYTPSDRHLAVLTGGVVMFDETVTGAEYGACRGTGVLVPVGDDWKVAQYHLTLPIPNDLFPEVAERVRRHLAH
jgi:hypothetical protein